MLYSEKWQGCTTTNVVVSAPGAGKYNLVKSISGHANATASIAICSPSTTTILWSGLCSALQPLVQVFPEGGEVEGAENSILYVTKSVAGGRVSATGVIQP
jgi:hypothetical protein